MSLWSIFPSWGSVGSATRGGAHVRTLSHARHGLGRAARAAAGAVRAAGSFDSTFALIQKVDLRAPRLHRSATCHGGGHLGGLDLRTGASPTTTWSTSPAQSPPMPGWRRVRAGQTEHSLLWLNLAAKTLPGQWQAPLRAMPLDPLPALSADELEAVRLWIEDGAPRDGVVAGHRRAARRLSAAAQAARDQAAAAAGARAPACRSGCRARCCRRQSEREVCFVSYYDVTDQVPRAVPRSERHLPLQAHQTRAGSAQPSHGRRSSTRAGRRSTTRCGVPFRCSGGAHDGEPCDPLEPRRLRRRRRLRQPPVRQRRLHRLRTAATRGIGLSNGGISITQQTARSSTTRRASTASCRCAA